MKRLILFGFILFPVLIQAQSTPVLQVTDFENHQPGDSPSDIWYALEFRGTENTQYAFVKDENGRTVVEANSKNAASGLIREVHIDPATHPVIEFSWKIEGVIPSGDVTRRNGDDYPARIYLTFDFPTDSLRGSDRVALNIVRGIYGRDQIPTRAMNYIWANKAEIDSIHPNPWTSLSRIIVVESGNERAGEWVTIRRNVYEDYKAAFGGEPPMINSIAIMTDSDNTGESARAWYSEIYFRTLQSLNSEL